MSQAAHRGPGGQPLAPGTEVRSQRRPAAAGGPQSESRPFVAITKLARFLPEAAAGARGSEASEA